MKLIVMGLLVHSLKSFKIVCIDLYSKSFDFYYMQVAINYSPPIQQKRCACLR